MTILRDAVTAATALIAVGLAVLRYYSTKNAKAKEVYDEIQKALANVAGICAAVAQDGNALGLTGTERKAEFQRIFQELTGVDPTRPEVEALRRDTIAAAKKIYDNYKTVPDAE